MHIMRRMLLPCQTFMSFSTTSAVLKNRSRAATLLQKFVARGSKGEGSLTPEALLKSVDSMSLGKGVSPHVLRRVTVLNKTYLEHIVEIIHNCAIYDKIVGEPIEISHVDITNDFKILNIYWYTDLLNVHRVPELDKKLLKYARELRYQLGQRRVIGNTPIVQFIKNTEIYSLFEVEQRLAQADFGEGYERNSVFLNPEHPVTYSVEKDCTRDGKLGLENEDELFSVTLPAMRHDVFGLNHIKIMNRIQASVNKKVMARERKLQQGSNKNHVRVTAENNTLPLFTDNKAQEQQFRKFLTQRKKLKRLEKKKSDEELKLNNIPQNAVYKESDLSNSNFYNDDEDWNSSDFSTDDELDKI